MVLVAFTGLPGTVTDNPSVIILDPLNPATAFAVLEALVTHPVLQSTSPTGERISLDLEVSTVGVAHEACEELIRRTAREGGLGGEGDAAQARGDSGS